MLAARPSGLSLRPQLVKRRSRQPLHRTQRHPDTLRHWRGVAWPERRIGGHAMRVARAPEVVAQFAGVLAAVAVQGEGRDDAGHRLPPPA